MKLRASIRGQRVHGVGYRNHLLADSLCMKGFSARNLRGDWQEELGERFDVAIRYLHRSIELGEQNLAVGRENLSIGRMMLEKQDRMLEKQDETIEELRGVR